MNTQSMHQSGKILAIMAMSSLVTVGVFALSVPGGLVWKYPVQDLLVGTAVVVKVVLFGCMLVALNQERERLYV